MDKLGTCTITRSRGLLKAIAKELDIELTGDAEFTALDNAVTALLAGELKKSDMIPYVNDIRHNKEFLYNHIGAALGRTIAPPPSIYI